MISFGSPIPFPDALEILRGKKAMPTNLSTADLAGMSKEVHELSLYSARTTSLDYLEEMRGQVAGLLDGSINEATARQNLQKTLDLLGYNETTHFGTEADRSIAPAVKGSLTDLASDRRIKLMLTMNTRLAANIGFMRAGMDPAALDQYPAWELVRIFPKVHPRGSTDNEGDVGWPERWVEAGAELVDGRMIALKDDAIWDNLGDSATFPDGTDSSAPPYAYESGMGLKNVRRAECVRIGLMDEDSEVTGKNPSLVSFLDSVPKSTVPLAQMKSDRAQLLAAAAALRGAA
jgi:hypothetical protein